MIKLKNNMTANGLREIEQTKELKKMLREHKITLQDFSDYAYVSHDDMLHMGKHKGEYDYSICSLEEVEEKINPEFIKNIA